MARPRAGRAPLHPWGAAAWLLAALPAAASSLVDGSALLQVDTKVAPAAAEGQLPEDQAHLRVDVEPKVVDLHRDHADAGDDRSAPKRVQMVKDAGQMEFVVKLIRDLQRDFGNWGGSPLDFSALMSNPTIMNGLLSGDLTKAVVDLSKKEKFPTSNDVRTTELLQGHSLLYNNLAVVVILSCVTLMPIIGHLIDRRTAKEGDEQSPRRFSARIGLLLLASYMIWVPAIFSADFSFNIGFIIPVTGQRMGITQDEHHHHTPGPIHESTRTLVHLLWSTKAHTGAILIAIYAFIVPSLKLILLGVGELFRFSEHVALRRLARTCIILMQFISKWAAPDMFGYVLLYYLIRKLQNPPVSTLGMFDIGFTCYSVFSLTCAVSSLGIPVPQVHSSAQDHEVKAPWVKKMLAGCLRTTPERQRLLRFTSLLTLAWAAFFLCGLFVPCFALRLDAALLRDHVPDSARAVLKMVKLDHIITPQDVSLWRAMWTMLYWFATDKDLNLLLAFVMIAGFAVCLTALNMANLLKTAWQLSQECPAGKHPCPALGKSEMLKHLSMLDVLLMGILVGTFAGGIYREEGIIIYIRSGIFVVLMAEAMHYLTYFVVHTVAEYEVKVAGIHAKILSYADGEKTRQ